MLTKFSSTGVERETVKVYERPLGAVKAINGCVNKGTSAWDWFTISKWITILIKKFPVEQLIEQRYTYYITPYKCKTVQQIKVFHVILLL